MYTFNKIIFIFLAFLFSYSCSNQYEEIRPTQIFTDSSSITGEKLDINTDTLAKPLHSLLIDSLLIIMDKKTSEHGLHIINVNQEKFIASTAKKGRGPKEIQIPLGLNLDPENPRSFNTYARLKNKIFTFNLDSILTKENYFPQEKIEFSESYLMPVQIQNKQFIATGPFEKGRYRISDSSCSNHEYKYGYPYDPSKKNVSNQTKSLAYQGKFTIQPGGNHLSFSTTNCGVLEFFRVNKNSIKKIKEHHFYNPDYEAKSNTSAPLSGENKMGFTGRSATKDYLYLLYSGRTFIKYRNQFLYGNIMLVFNWNGEPVKYYKLDKAVRSISVTDNNKTLYAYASLPQPSILKYKLNHSQ